MGYRKMKAQVDGLGIKLALGFWLCQPGAQIYLCVGELCPKQDGQVGQFLLTNSKELAWVTAIHNS